MAHEFSHDPIKIRIIDLKKSQNTQTYVFVGEVPLDVSRELAKCEKKPTHTSNTLKKFYGNDWRAKLGLAQLSKISKLGGAEFEVDDDLLASLDNLNIDMHDTAQGATIQTSTIQSAAKVNKPETIVEENIIPSNIQEDSGDLLDEHYIETNTSQLSFLDVKEDSLYINHSGGVKFIENIAVTPLDNMLDLKYKIFAAIGIPIYRQHLWFKYKDRSYPVNYYINKYKQHESVNIERLSKFYQANTTSAANTKHTDQTGHTKYTKPTDHTKYTKHTDQTGHTKHTNTTYEDIEGIPIDLSYYNNKDFITISAHDTFEILRNIYYKYGTTEYFLVDLNSLINVNDLYDKIGKDRYQLDLVYYGFIAIYWPMITQSVFLDYLKNEHSLKEFYVELAPSKSSLINRIEMENNITLTAYNAIDDAQIDKRLFSSITATTISVNNYNQDVDVVLSLRNLFDVLELNDTITYCRADLLHNNQRVILRKSYMNEEEPKEQQTLNSVLIKIKTQADTMENVQLILYKNGNYIIKTNWREENHMNFDKIIDKVSKKVNPIIQMINKYGERIKYHKMQLVELTKANMVFTETAMCFYYDDDTTDANYNILKNILVDLNKAGILMKKENTTNLVEYFFVKGMYRYDAERIDKIINVSNYYEYLSNGIVQNKWDSIFNRTRLFQLTNVSSKLKFTINGIRNDIEMDNFIIYLKGILAIYNENAQKSPATSVATKKSLKTLKTQDPLLYDFKKIYKSNVIYSKICQKPYQPTMLSEDEYKALPDDRKKNALRYWNFTRQTPVWYSCPGTKYPYIKFIVKQHPKDFCIPCCKKVEMGERVNQKKQEIHKTCMSSYKYTGEKVALTKTSHYIASYGKTIEPGRIARLPEHTLEPLFFDTYSAEGGVDQECVTADGYYLFGVYQHLKSIEYVGMIHCIAHALNSTPVEFLADSITKLRKSPDKFHILLNGNTTMYFKDLDDLCDKISDLDADTITNVGNTGYKVNSKVSNKVNSKVSNKVNSKVSNKVNSKVGGNVDGSDVVGGDVDGSIGGNVYYDGNYNVGGDGNYNVGVNIIESIPWNILFMTIAYYYFGVNVVLFSDQQKELIDLILPKGLKNYNEMFPQTHKNLVVLQRKKLYYPIYLFNTEMFKRTGLIDTRLFHNESGLITIIKAVVRQSFDVIVDKIKTQLDLAIVKEFCKSIKCSIVHYYINYANLCYAVNIDFHGTKFYFPISTSHYPLESNISLIFTPYDGKFNGTYETCMKFLALFKKYNLEKSKLAGFEGILIYPNITVQQWIQIRGTTEIIGFIHDNYNYFISPISEKAAIKLSDKPIQTLMYNPIKINNLIYKVKQGQIQTGINQTMEHTLNQSLYDYYLHNIVLMHYISIFNEQRNTTERKRIYNILSKINFDKNIESIRTLLESITNAEDSHKLKNIIGRFVNVHHNKKQMFSDIDKTYFTFDRISLEKLRGMPVTEIKKQLLTLASKFVVFGKPNIKHFPNMFMDCNTNEKIAYCSGSKLMIEKSRLNDIIDVLASDMANPAKWKWIFNSVFIERTIDYYKFIRRKHETITIEFVHE